MAEILLVTMLLILKPKSPEGRSDWCGGMRGRLCSAYYMMYYKLCIYIGNLWMKIYVLKWCIFTYFLNMAFMCYWHPELGPWISLGCQLLCFSEASNCAIFILVLFRASIREPYLISTMWTCVNCWVSKYEQLQFLHMKCL